MNRKDQTLISELKKRLPENVKTHIRKMIVFGSRARSQGDDDSDLDLLILVDRKTPELIDSIGNINYKVMWDYDFKPIISLKFSTEVDYNKYLADGFSFYKNIAEEGILV